MFGEEGRRDDWKETGYVPLLALGGSFMVCMSYALFCKCIINQ